MYLRMQYIIELNTNSQDFFKIFCARQPFDHCINQSRVIYYLVPTQFFINLFILC